MVPDAFGFEYAGESGGLTKVSFKPNPNFQPPSREGKVLHEMAGEIWVDAKQQRLVSRDWEVTELAVNMRGRALLFKTISVQQKELHQNFERVPDDLSMSDAAALLLKQSLIAARR